MKNRYPSPLPKQGTIAVTAPASPVDKKKLNRGVQYLHNLGYRVITGETCRQKHYYVAGDDKSRAKEFMDFIEDDTIDAIFCARGGYGSMRILPLLDYQSIRKQAKLVVGFSDITALQWAIWQKSRLVTLSAGMVATDLARVPIDKTFENNFWQLVNEGTCTYTLSYDTHREQQLHGYLLPGTLSVGLRLLGSSYLPDQTDIIPLLEDVNEPTHKLEGHLLQFYRAGFLRNLPAIIFGHFTPPEREEYRDPPSHGEIIQYVFDESEMPVITGLSYGHIAQKFSLPVGASISLYLGSNSYITTEDSIYRS